MAPMTFTGHYTATTNQAGALYSNERRHMNVHDSVWSVLQPSSSPNNNNNNNKEVLSHQTAPYSWQPSSRSSGIPQDLNENQLSSLNELKALKLLERNDSRHRVGSANGRNGRLTHNDRSNDHVGDLFTTSGTSVSRDTRTTSCHQRPTSAMDVGSSSALLNKKMRIQMRGHRGQSTRTNVHTPLGDTSEISLWQQNTTAEERHLLNEDPLDDEEAAAAAKVLYNRGHSMNGVTPDPNKVSHVKIYKYSRGEHSSAKRAITPQMRGSWGPDHHGHLNRAVVNASPIGSLSRHYVSVDYHRQGIQAQAAAGRESPLRQSRINDLTNVTNPPLDLQAPKEFRLRRSSHAVDDIRQRREQNERIIGDGGKCEMKPPLSTLLSSAGSVDVAHLSPNRRQFATSHCNQTGFYGARGVNGVYHGRKTLKMKQDASILSYLR